MFTQAHRSVNNMHRGTSLGLWICKQFCMGGDIKLYSQPDRGTAFVFHIPINNDQISLVQPARNNTQQSVQNVMIVDDYINNKELHKFIVEEEGANVILASNGKEAGREVHSSRRGIL